MNTIDEDGNGGQDNLFYHNSPILSTTTMATVNEFQKFYTTMVYSNTSVMSSSSSIVVAVDSSDFQPFTKASTSEMVEMIYQMILFAVGTPINVVALIKFSKTSKSSFSEMRLMKLSRQLLIAHLMVLCVYCVWRTYWFYNITWTQGNILCKIYSFLTALPFHLWSNIVAAIATDMLYCIAAPLSCVHNGNKCVSWLIGISWGTALAFSAPMMLFRGTVKIPNTEYEQCYPLMQDFDESVLLGFHVFHVITTFYLPLCIIVFCYICIGLTLRVRMAERRTLGENRKKCHNVNTKFLLGTICIVCTFILTWLPYQAMALLRIICAPNSTCEVLVSKLTWLQAILITSTCINPFLYKFGIFSKNRRTVKLGSNFTPHSQLGISSIPDSSIYQPSLRFQRNGNLRYSARSLGSPNSGNFSPPTTQCLRVHLDTDGDRTVTGISPTNFGKTDTLRVHKMVTPQMSLPQYRPLLIIEDNEPSQGTQSTEDENKKPNTEKELCIQNGTQVY